MMHYKSAHEISASEVQMVPRNVMVKSGYFCQKLVLGYKIGVFPDVTLTHDQF